MVGARVFLPATRCYGVVRFFGPTHFASDLWVGVELDTPKGKNSGEVQVRHRIVYGSMCDEWCRIVVCAVVVGPVWMGVKDGKRSRGDPPHRPRMASVCLCV